MEGSPTARFWQEFPDGKVPIRAVYHPSCTYDTECEEGAGFSQRRQRFFAWAKAATEVVDTARSLVSVPIDQLEHAREQFLICAPSEWETRKQHVVTMMRGGLTLRQIGRYCEVHPFEVVRSLLRHHDHEAAVILVADELLRGGRPTVAVAAATGLATETVEVLAAACSAPADDPCACGCGRSLSAAGRRRSAYASRACSMRALREQRRGAA